MMKTILFVKFCAIITITFHTPSVLAFAPKLQPSAVTGASSNRLVIGTTQLYGLFDGMKEAFTAPALERSALDANRETPIDRWMGWNVQSEDSPSSTGKAPVNFVDSMDESNYVIASLSKPMGIVFEENDEEFGGIFVLSLSEGGNAENDGKIKPGDQLVAVNEKKVAGMQFDDALGTIVEATTEKTKLVFFRGDEVQLYGPTGASKEWLDEFISKA